MKKDIKLYNMIIPPFFVIGFTPWFLGLSIVGNFIIDSAVVLIVSIILFKRLDFKFCIKKAPLAYLFGFAADFVGMFYIVVLSIVGARRYSDIPKNTFIYDVAYGIGKLANTSAEVTPFTVAFIISAIVLSAVLIFLANYFVVFRSRDISKKQRLIFALSLAVLTAPYTMLLRCVIFVV